MFLKYKIAVNISSTCHPEYTIFILWNILGIRNAPEIGYISAKNLTTWKTALDNVIAWETDSGNTHIL